MPIRPCPHLFRSWTGLQWPVAWHAPSIFAASIDELVYVCRACKFTRVTSTPQCYYPVAKTTEASFLSVDSRCLTEKINPLLRTRPQNTGIHDECEVRYRVFAARVCWRRITSPVSVKPVTDSAVPGSGEKQPLRNFGWFAYRCLRKYIHFRRLAHKWGETRWIKFYTADWHGQRSVLSQLCVSSTTLGDTQRMLGLLGAAPGVVTYLRRKHR